MAGRGAKKPKEIVGLFLTWLFFNENVLLLRTSLASRENLELSWMRKGGIGYEKYFFHKY